MTDEQQHGRFPGPRAIAWGCGALLLGFTISYTSLLVAAQDADDRSVGTPAVDAGSGIDDTFDDPGSFDDLPSQTEPGQAVDAPPPPPVQKQPASDNTFDNAFDDDRLDDGLDEPALDAFLRTDDSQLNSANGGGRSRKQTEAKFDAEQKYFRNQIQQLWSRIASLELKLKRRERNRGAVIKDMLRKSNRETIPNVDLPDDFGIPAPRDLEGIDPLDDPIAQDPDEPGGLDDELDSDLDFGTRAPSIATDRERFRSLPNGSLQPQSNALFGDDDSSPFASGFTPAPKVSMIASKLDTGIVGLEHVLVNNLQTLKTANETLNKKEKLTPAEARLLAKIASQFPIVCEQIDSQRKIHAIQLASLVKRKAQIEKLIVNLKEANIGNQALRAVQAELKSCDSRKELVDKAMNALDLKKLLPEGRVLKNKHSEAMAFPDPLFNETGRSSADRRRRGYSIESSEPNKSDDGLHETQRDPNRDRSTQRRTTRRDDFGGSEIDDLGRNGSTRRDNFDDAPIMEDDFASFGSDTFTGRVVFVGNPNGRKGSDPSLIVGKNKGVKNVFVYLAKTPKKVVPTRIPRTPVKFDRQKSKFVPHCLLMRTNQIVKLLNNDKKAHNVHTYPARNKPSNLMIAANDRKGSNLIYKVTEAKPFSVKCDFEADMSAWHLPLDHSFAAITNEKGHFSIENLPAGKHEFHVWHEAVKGGFLTREFTVNVPISNSAPRSIMLLESQLIGSDNSPKDLSQDFLDDAGDSLDSF